MTFDTQYFHLQKLVAFNYTLKPHDGPHRPLLHIYNIHIPQCIGTVAPPPRQILYTPPYWPHWHSKHSMYSSARIQIVLPVTNYSQLILCHVELIGPTDRHYNYSPSPTERYY